MTDQPPNQFERFKRNLLDIKPLAIISLVAVVIISIAAFKDALKSIFKELGNFLTYSENIAEFVISGDLLTGELPYLTDPIAVKVFWLNEKTNNFSLQSPELSYVRPEAGRMSYRLALARPPNRYLIRDDFIHLAIGRVFAFQDANKDGFFSGKEDRLVAASKEFIEYVDIPQRRKELTPQEKDVVTRLREGYTIKLRKGVGIFRKTRIVSTSSPTSIDLVVSEERMDRLSSELNELLEGLQATSNNRVETDAP